MAGNDSEPSKPQAVPSSARDAGRNSPPESLIARSEHCATWLARSFLDTDGHAGCPPNTHARTVGRLARSADAPGRARRRAVVVAARPSRVSPLLGAEEVIWQKPPTVRNTSVAPTFALYD
jgi:hypothetical protein